MTASNATWTAFSRVPTDEEVADALRMSRRGFFGAAAALTVAPYWAPTPGLPGTLGTVQWDRHGVVFAWYQREALRLLERNLIFDDPSDGIALPLVQGAGEIQWYRNYV